MEKSRASTIGASIDSPQTSALASIITQRFGFVRPKVLVVGCGSGREAVVLARDLNANVVGIDIKAAFDVAAFATVDLRQCDATRLDLDDESFDMVFSYHVLEHIPRYNDALNEIRRVLRPNGAWCIGTPNRLRLFAYVMGDYTLGQRIIKNLNDWKARLRGRFRNEHGAHAGYSSAELERILLTHFTRCEDITLTYYQRLYQRKTRSLALIARLGLGRVIFPSVYFVGRR